VILSQNHSSAAGLPLDLDLIRDRLAGRRLGAELHYFAEIGSTNTYARRLAEQGARDGELVIADSQTDGRGRLGRHWVSPPNVNLYFSVILRPKLAPARAPQITLMAAVALAETLESFLPVPPAIKWPNDITVNGKKLAGILSEMSCGIEAVDFVILGIGVNVNYPVDLMPEEIRQSATSVLAECQKKISREDFLRRLIQHLDRCYGEIEENGFAPLAPRWEAYFGSRGQRVRIEILDQVMFGTAKGIDHDGALLLEDDHGRLQRIIAGDVTAVSK
jgi:BirA family transcriptional regulator, biotin operon repressor / biotin---[acetyl-CoA-carboxylase] ligase